MKNSITLKGVRQNNLKDFDLEIPKNKLTVITGVSGSGKSSLAFDTLFAEGQRRYIETFSPYARQFFDRMDKPEVDLVEGIPPSIAIEQKNSVKSTRSTVGTMTEICDYMKDLWFHFSQPICPSCEGPIVADSPESIWEQVSRGRDEGDTILITFRVALSAALGVAECLRGIMAQGYQRCLFAGKIWKLDSLLESGRVDDTVVSIDVVQDRIKVVTRSRSRFIESCEQAFSFGSGRLAVCHLAGAAVGETVGEFSQRLECSGCGEVLGKPTRSLFSFNSPVGACSTCRGFGRVIGVDYYRAIPDQTLSLAGGAVKPWQSGHGLRSQKDMMKLAKREGIPTQIPFRELSEEQRRWVVYGSPGYGEGTGQRWPHAWYGLKGYFDWLESKAYKMHYRVLLARYRAYRVCSDCEGGRFKPEVQSFRIDLNGVKSDFESLSGGRWLTLPGFYQFPVSRAKSLVEGWERSLGVQKNHPVAYALSELRSRLQFLEEVGLGYLTLDRPTKTLSGGETQRINLTRCLGTRLVNTLFVLDEPSVGLHAVDISRLIRILLRLRDAGNTLVVVEHESAIMRAADYLVDIGPESGTSGGHLVAAGTVKQVSKCRESLTGRYLSGDLEGIVEPPPIPTGGELKWLKVRGATRHNIVNLDLDIPLNRLVCLTGVSGSGKTTLAKELIVPGLERLLGQEKAAVEQDLSEETTSDTADGINNRLPEFSNYEGLTSLVMIDQSPIGRTPRSNPAVYIGVFDSLRKLFASSAEAAEKGLKPGAFSFNSALGRCERCGGAGYEKIEMQFLSDVFVSCPDCNGTRYRRHIRELRIDFGQFARKDGSGTQSGNSLSIVDLLASTVDEVVSLLGSSQVAAARRARSGLCWLRRAGLGYLRLGQPVNTLSGGESQRLKVVRHLAAAEQSRQTGDRALFVFDEPTTGLHSADVTVLINMLRQMQAAGHSLLVIEHHLELIQSADWIIDLGPGGGVEGGQIVGFGGANDLRVNSESLTGKCLENLM